MYYSRPHPGWLYAVIEVSLTLLQPVAKSLTLTPSSIKVSVIDRPVDSDSVKFAMFKAVLSGTVTCLSSCGAMDVMLSSSDQHGNDKVQKV